MTDAVATRESERPVRLMLSLACLVSAASGFFDGGLGNDEVPASAVPLQWLLVGATGVVGVLAARAAAHLRRRG